MGGKITAAVIVSVLEEKEARRREGEGWAFRYESGAGSIFKGGHKLCFLPAQFCGERRNFAVTLLPWRCATFLASGCLLGRR